nr:unnamed protein product [Digitaria exilis]
MVLDILQLQMGMLTDCRLRWRRAAYTTMAEKLLLVGEAGGVRGGGRRLMMEPWRCWWCRGGHPVVEVLVVSSWAAAGWRTRRRRCGGERRHRGNGGSVDLELGGNGRRRNAGSTRSDLAEQRSLEAGPESPEKRWVAAEKIRATVAAGGDLFVRDVRTLFS